MRRRELLIAAGAASALPLQTNAQTFPSKSILVYCPFTAGGPTDVVIRAIAEVATRVFGQSVVIENKAGAAGTITAPIMRNSKPDGYTLTVCPMGMFRIPHMQKVQTFDPTKDFTYIINLTGYAMGMVVRSDSPFKSVKDLVEYAKANPGAITYGSPGLGTGPHLLMDEFATKAGIKLTHVPYKGSSDMLPALLGGHIMAGTDTAGWAPYVNDGRMRLLATYGSQRTKHWPNVMTLKELGYGIESDSPYGIVGPRGMDSAVVNALHDGFKTALYDPKVIDVLDRYNQPVVYMNPSDYTAWAIKTYDEEDKTAQRLGTKGTL